MSASCQCCMHLVTLLALIPYVISVCEFRLWQLDDTTYASQGWSQLTIAELQQLKNEFIAQYNNDNGIRPLAAYSVSDCKICQGANAVGYDWTTFVCPTTDNSDYEWNLNVATYYRFLYHGGPVYYPLSTTGTFSTVSTLCGTSQHSIVAKCPSPTKSPTPSPTPAPTQNPTAAPTLGPTRYGDDCEDRGYIYHYNWDNTSLGQHPYFDYKIDIDASDLSVRFEANLEYIGYSTAKSQYGLGSTYVLDFAPFDGFNDHINKPRNCSNRLPLSFINKSFSEYWRYSTTPYNVNHYGTLDYLAYPPSGDKWSLTMGYGNPWIECARIKYVAYFNWVELNECEDNQGNSLMNIDVDSNFITLSGRFYIDLVSPKSNDKELDVYYVKPILQKSFAMKISRSVQIIDSTNIESFLITIYQSHRLFDNTDSTHGSHLIRISTQIAHYMQLTSPLVITSPTYQWQIRNISDEQCVFERDSICTQYWDVYMVRSVECPLEFAGIYHLHFSAICNLEINDTESCDDYIKAYNGTVELEFSLSYSDPFKCNDTQLEDILFDASMLFYNDINFANLVNNGDQFRSGIDVIYGEVIVDIPSNSLSVFEVSLLNIWTCTVDASLENYVKIDENEIFTGCFDSAIVDAGSTANVMINGKSQLNFDAHLINSENKTNIVRYSFLAPSWVARDILYVHCQIKISLIDHNDRRLLIDNDENVVNFGNIQSIVHVIEGVLIDMENHATTTQITTTKITTIIGEDDIQLSGDSHIDLMTIYIVCIGIGTVIMVLIMVICCMFCYMRQKRVNDENLMTQKKLTDTIIVTQKRVSETQH